MMESTCGQEPMGPDSLLSHLGVNKKGVYFAYILVQS